MDFFNQRQDTLRACKFIHKFLCSVSRNIFDWETQVGGKMAEFL